MELIFATHNTYKADEVKKILAHTGIRVKTLSDIGYHEEIIEDGDTLEVNAWIKADIISRHTGMNVVADDTGLEVLSLGGAPGVRSARYAGPEKDSQANINKLLHALESTDSRQAQFRTVVAGLFNGERIQCEGVIKGLITTERRGTGGFGYDPVFIPEEYELTFGELSETIKNKISHRARAFEALRKILISKK